MFPWNQDPYLGPQEPAEASAFTVTKSQEVSKLPEASYLRWGFQMAGHLWAGLVGEGHPLFFLWQKFLVSGCPGCGPVCGLPGSEVRDQGGTHGVLSPSVNWAPNPELQIGPCVLRHWPGAQEGVESK